MLKKTMIVGLLFVTSLNCFASDFLDVDKEAIFDGTVIGKQGCIYPTDRDKKGCELDPKLIKQMPFGIILALLLTPAGRGAASAVAAEVANDGYKFKDKSCMVWVANDAFISFYWNFVAAKKTGVVPKNSCDDIKALVQELKEVAPFPAIIFKFGTHIVKCACEAARI